MRFIVFILIAIIITACSLTHKYVPYVSQQSQMSAINPSLSGFLAFRHIYHQNDSYSLLVKSIQTGQWHRIPINVNLTYSELIKPEVLEQYAKKVSHEYTNPYVALYSLDPGSYQPVAIRIIRTSLFFTKDTSTHLAKGNAFTIYQDSITVLGTLQIEYHKHNMFKTFVSIHTRHQDIDTLITTYTHHPDLATRGLSHHNLRVQVGD
jgi:hypothetical protein